MITAAWFWLSIVAMAAWGITGVTQKLSTNNISTQLSFLAFSLTFVPIAITVWLLFPVNLDVSLGLFLLGALCGVLNGCGALTAFAAFEAGGRASIVIPIVSLYPLISVLGARLFLHEEISRAHWTGILLAPIAAWLLSQEEQP